MMMRKRKIAMAAAMLLLAATATAQVFVLDKDGNNRPTIDNVDGFIPQNGLQIDQGEYVPAGSGALLLAALGCAYLMGKKRKC